MKQLLATCTIALYITMGTLWAPMASAQDPAMQQIAKTALPAVVRVLAGDRVGTGFVVDAAKGLVATNFHLVEHTTKGDVVFRADKAKKKYPIDGFIDALPGKDLIILHVAVQGKKLEALKLASESPKIGDIAYVFVPDFDQPDERITSGNVSVNRSGRELADIWDSEEGKGFLKTVFCYDGGCAWIQQTAKEKKG